MTHRLLLPFACMAAMLCGTAVGGAAEWRAVERVAPYAVAGTTPGELYASIGERGPKAGAGRAIAHTGFKLTWTRRYENPDGACTIASAVPKLTITYTLPEPSRRLAGETARRWDAFAAGIAAHERVHGEHILAMVREIEAATVGWREPDDPDCRKFRAAMTARLSAISERQRGKSRDFDRMETSDGGAVQQLILRFLNGP